MVARVLARGQILNLVHEIFHMEFLYVIWFKFLNGYGIFSSEVHCLIQFCNIFFDGLWILRGQTFMDNFAFCKELKIILQEAVFLTIYKTLENFNDFVA